MRTFFIKILFIIPFAINAQSKDKTFELGTVVSDTNFLDKTIASKMGVQNIFKSKNTIEIRLYSDKSINNPWCAILWYSANRKIWIATKYTYDTQKSQLLMKNPQSSISLDTIFKLLTSYNIFSLRSHDQLPTTKYSIDLKSNSLVFLETTVMDGVCYTIEFKALDAYRQYSYCNPAEYLKSLPNTHEFKDFVDILNIFKTLENE